MKQCQDATPAILSSWRDGVAVAEIAAEHGKTERAVQLLAAYHKVRRPAWYLSAVRGSVSQIGKGAAK